MGKRGDEGKRGDDGKRGRRSQRQVLIALGRDGADDADHVIDDPATLKAFYDPLRFRLMRLLDEPRAVRELAAEVGMPANRLYYHVRLLEQRGLVKVVEERIVGNNVERLYGRAANRFTLSDELASSPLARVVDQRLASLERSFSGYLADLDAEGVAAFEGQGVVRRVLDVRGPLDADRARRFSERLGRLVDEFFGEEQDAAQPPKGQRARSEDTTTYGLLVVLTPRRERGEGDP